MAIGTYGELKTALTNRLGRSDLVTLYDDFMALAHATIFNGGEASEPLRVSSMLANADLTLSSDTVALPSGFLGARVIYLNTNPKRELSHVAVTQFYGSRSDSSGLPVIFTLEGSNMIVAPSPDSAYTAKVLYYSKPDIFTEDSDTNSLLTTYPGIFLQALVAEAAQYARIAGLLSDSRASLAALIERANDSDAAAQWGGSSKVQRPWI